MRAAPLAIVLCVCLAAHVQAQSVTGGISGTVRDPGGNGVPDATVTIVSADTSRARDVSTGPEGRFRAPDLPPGRYRVTASHEGFSPTPVAEVLVVIDHDVTLTLTLELPSVAEHVAVRAETSLVDTSGTATGGVVFQNQIEELPLNGRSFLQLAALQPGVIVSRGTGKDFSGGFGAVQPAIAGARPEQTGYLLDGTNIADISDKAPSSLAGVMLGVDAVREFSVQTHGYSAEYGRAAGGIISAVTRSGSNRFHGTAFEFHRGSALDAHGEFDPPDPPDFRRNQFGGSLGGPIRKDSLFFFGDYEGLRDQSVVTRAARLPNAAAHQGLLPDSSGTLHKVTIAPTVQPYLDLLFPIPDGQDFGDGTAELLHTHQDPTDENFYVGKVDWNAGRADTFTVRLSHDASRAVGSLDHPLFLEHTSTGTRYFTAQHAHVFTTAVNSLRFAANRTQRDHDVLPTVDIPQSLYFTEDPHFGAITVTGLTMAGSSGTIPATYDQQVYQAADTFTWNRGAHLWKFGADWQMYQFGGVSYSSYGGEFRFRNLQEFLTLKRSASAQADRFLGNEPGTDTTRHMTQHYAAFFAQDEWRLNGSVTMNLGLRYEFVTTPTERDGQVAGLLSLNDLESGPHGVTPGAPLFDNPSKRSVAPRLGIAWSPGESGRTRVSGGYGLFDQPLTVSYYRGTIFRIYPYYEGVDIKRPPVFGPGIQDVLAAGTNVQRRSEFIAYDAQQPFVEQWHASVEREIGGGVTAEVAYLGSKGHNLPFYGDPNAVPSVVGPDGRKTVVAGAGLRYPDWGRIRTRINVAHSLGNALTFEVKRRMKDRLVLQGAYTLAKSTDTWSGGQAATADFDNGAGSATDWWDPEAELGPSNFDVRHSLVVNATYEIPWGETLTGVAGVLARGWSVSGLLQAASGLPFTPFIGFDRAGDQQSDADAIQKPDQIAPITYPRTADAWFDVTAFGLPPAGTYGNAGRNSLRGPGLKVVDLAAIKNTVIGGTTLQFRVEAFNAFNWVNLGLPDASVLFNADGSYHAGAGRITTTATPARQVQLGVKVMF